jgi:hypothetical protein
MKGWVRVANMRAAVIKPTANDAYYAGLLPRKSAVPQLDEALVASKIMLFSCNTKALI